MIQRLSILGGNDGGFPSPISIDSPIFRRPLSVTEAAFDDSVPVMRSPAVKVPEAITLSARIPAVEIPAVQPVSIFIIIGIVLISLFFKFKK